MAYDDAHAHGGDHGANEPHVLPMQVYYAVFGALIVLTVLTVAVSIIGLGPFAIAAAVIIAVVKAGLVVGFFMHLRYEVKFLALIFFSCVLFLCIFFFLTMADLGARDGLLKEEGTFYRKRVEKTGPKKARKLLTKKPKVAPAKR